MLFVALISFLAGVVLGWRYKAPVLVPAMATVLVLVLVVETTRSETPWLMALALGAAIASLQIGYFAGALIRYVLPSSRTSRVRSSWLATHSR